MSTWKISRWLAEQGHDVAVFASARSGHKAQSFARLFVGAEAIKGFSPESGIALRRALRDFSPQVVINQMPYEWPLGDLLLENRDYVLLGCLRNTLFSVKQNAEDRGGHIRPGGAHSLLRQFFGHAALQLAHRVKHGSQLKRILRTYDRFIMFGPPNLDELRYFVRDFDSGKVSLIPNSVPGVSDDVPAKEKRVLWLGRLEHRQKRAELIVPLWNIVSKALPDWHLDIVGDGPARAFVENQVAESQLERITMHGRQVPDDYYRRSPVYVMTSAWEGFPNTVVEAQSYGAVPVLFDSFPIAKWMVKAGRNGLLVPPFDIDAMAQNVIELAHSKDLPLFMAASLENARRFHIDNVGREWEALFDELLHERLIEQQ
jgi:glycosyltransferase involved in cell wall biosynthesis